MLRMLVSRHEQEWSVKNRDCYHLGQGHSKGTNLQCICDRLMSSERLYTLRSSAQSWPVSVSASSSRDRILPEKYGFLYSRSGSQGSDLEQGPFVTRLLNCLKCLRQPGISYPDRLLVKRPAQIESSKKKCIHHISSEP